MKSYVLPPTALSWARWLRWRIFSRPPGQVCFGDLRRPRPLAPGFGGTRGGPIDRYYIEAFLGRNAADIRGRTLEIGDNTYTLRFGGGRVTRSDVLHVKAGNPLATIVADLARGDDLPSDTFDCVILTQTLHMIYDYRAVLQTVHRILKPGGVVLLTTPGITKTDQGEWPWYWAFTELSMRRLMAEVFPPEAVTVESHGNVLAAVSFLHGLGVAELAPEELDVHDRDCALTVAVRAVKPPLCP
jgi:SAM-dependent methyltransferase